MKVADDTADTVGDAVAEGRRVRVRVRALASSGAGVADLPDGRVVFVHRTAPGDEVNVLVERVRRRWATGRLVDMVVAGPAREEAPCPLYGSCGGCTLQHLSYAAQLAWKARFVSDALTRIGGVNVPPPEVWPSPLARGYRNRVTFTLRRLRNGRVVAGFHHLERAHRIVDVRDECLLPEEPVMVAWAALREAWGPGARRLPGAGELRITVRSIGTGHDGVVILVRGGAAGWSPGDLLARIPGCRALWHQPEGAPPVLVADAPSEDAGGAEDTLLGSRAFVQVNRGAAAHLRSHVLALALAGAPGPGRAVDAYCGVGVYGRALAQAGWRVQGIEVDPDACAAARHGAPADFVTVEGRVEEQLASYLPADVVIVNPPRTGLDQRVPAFLAAEPVPRLIYVSCDPATLARDVARFSDTYALVGLHCFDLFPQTAQVESVALLTLPGHSGEED